jgi:hypothetical protein
MKPLERKPVDPSEEQILAACERLRSGWSRAKLARRAAKAIRVARARPISLSEARVPR